ncbi:maintenance of mitochondrial structure and function-domain-containing protein [Halteromyces radiatus]|uniref:maintenance of mitochondrial structure and function-domain-containing protein n=1 Tax=Halteromyces radiatus TaxID=101107 RepID=UPI00221F89CB|nr:maintenance of mitochondrial structure and function-domain-containing protein [Halteromyces radiatus]KAI8090059.1 maintenance of mitochondrial structure and function-domain-containing protein [Halteromyces radiatus]
MNPMTTTESSSLEQLPIVSSIESNSGLSISIHPLVLLNISDHYTRSKLQNPTTVNIYGALLAQQSGRDIDIIHSFEFSLQQDGKSIDQVYMSTKLEQMKQVFPELDFMGWYTTGTTPTELDLIIHEQFLSRNESSLFLQLDPSAITGEHHKSLPVGMYESLYDTNHELHKLMFVKTPYKIETNEAERIAVDHVAKPDMSSIDSSLGSSLASYMTTQKNAVIMLHARLQFLQKYLQDTKTGAIPTDHDILRQISSICSRSPVIDQSIFDDQFSREYNDVLLVGYLASITKGINTINDLVDKFNLAHGTTNLPRTQQAGSSSNRKGRRSHVV